MAGRICPADYVYSPSVFDRAAEIEAETLYVVGGLYGNLAALDTIDRLIEAERSPPLVIFNGDFHWFDAEPAWFAEIDRRVARHTALRGNVETEIARPDDIGAGCGCVYPVGVDDGVVRRSNEILTELRNVVPAPSRTQLMQLPMHRVARIGRLRVGIVHGDAASLAGWRFCRESLDDPKNLAWLADVRSKACIDVFASTHTCLAALRDLALPRGRLTIVNNGAAGMPNFTASTFGVITRIATTRSPHRALYGINRDGVHIDALAVHYDQRAFLDRFLGRWPEGSPAHRSYFARIIEGPDYAMAHALA